MHMPKCPGDGKVLKYQVPKWWEAFLALVHAIPSWMVWSEIECRAHVALAAQKALKPISTSFTKQAIGTKSLLSQYIICEQGP